jgi:hypothetical protein
MDPTKIRARYLICVLAAAVITAAVLRHTLHVHAGFERIEIFVLAIAALVVILVAVMVRRVGRG